jgi:hypothetical protein
MSAAARPISATDLLVQGGRLTQRRFFGLIAPNYSAAIDKYTQAAQAFKFDKQWSAAANAYSYAADCADAAGYTNASLSAKKDQVHMLCTAGKLEDADRLLTACVIPAMEKGALYYELVRFIGKIGPLFEPSRPEVSIRLYDLGEKACAAADCTAARYDFLKRKAQMQAKLENYQHAAATLETLALSRSETCIFTNYSGEVVLLLLAHGDVPAATTKAAELDPARISKPFKRDWVLAQDILHAVTASDAAAFDRAVDKFNAIVPVDPWLNPVLQKIRSRIITA